MPLFLVLSLIFSVVAPAHVGIVEARTAQTESVGDPASAAVAYSGMEADGRFEQLYEYLHPDAKAIVPEAAVVGWYRDTFAPMGPDTITVTDVRFVSWTWGVTGVTYPETAEVSFLQPFANAPMASEVVRLVQSEGEWRWFFGRSREFVEEQITRYADTSTSPQSSCDGATEWWAITYPRVLSAEYRAFTLTNLLGGGDGIDQILREYERGFGSLYAEQSNSIPPTAASELHQDFLFILSRYEYASSNFASVASGNMNPLAESAAFAAAVEALDDGEMELEELRATIDGFVESCQPLVVFVPGLGGDMVPSPVLPGEAESAGYMSVECGMFRDREAAQRFFEAAGDGDPHALDRDGDGVACEVGE